MEEFCYDNQFYRKTNSLSICQFKNASTQHIGAHRRNKFSVDNPIKRLLSQHRVIVISEPCKFEPITTINNPPNDAPTATESKCEEVMSECFFSPCGRRSGVRWDTAGGDVSPPDAPLMRDNIWSAHDVHDRLWFSARFRGEYFRDVPHLWHIRNF